MRILEFRTLPSLSMNISFYFISQCLDKLAIVYFNSPSIASQHIVDFLSLWPLGLVFATRLPGFFLSDMLSLLIFLFSWLEIQEVAYANTEIQDTAQPYYVVKLRQELPNNN